MVEANLSAKQAPRDHRSLRPSFTAIAQKLGNIKLQLHSICAFEA